MRTAAVTDKGLVRSSNQDTVFRSETPVGALPNLFMVADGMGGHRAGDYCSRMLVKRITEDLNGSGIGMPVRALKHAVESANLSLFRESASDPELSGMGSTLVAAYTEEDTLNVFNIGDSRLYVTAPDGSLRQVTRDHSYVEEMVSAGRMVRGSESYNRNKNIITRAVGIGPEVEADIFEVPFTETTKVLLCSDGLTNMLSDAEIAEVLKENGDPQTAAEELINKANGKGGRDNISVVLVMPSGKEASV